MDNANKAIIMAFGMIVAVMILGTIVYVFTRLSSLPRQDDDLQSIEQVRVFNQEYEVYDKKIMYGVDVISVLNKAQSNNEKYVKTKYYSGVGYNTDYIINIVVTLKNEITETMEVSYLNTTSRGVIDTQYAGGDGPGVSSGATINANTIFKSPSNEYQQFIYPTGKIWNTSLKLKAQTISTKIKPGSYQLLAGKSEPMSLPSQADHPDSDRNTNYTNSMIDNDSILKQLLKQSATMSQSVRNTGSNKSEGGWNQATWYPAIYDLKTRKFKCEGEKVVYSAKTGRIVYMEFTEV